MILLRRELGEALREERTAQGRSLRGSRRPRLGLPLATSARSSSVAEGSLDGASTTSVCGALGVPLSDVLSDVSLRVARAEAEAAGVPTLPVTPARRGVSASARPCAARAEPSPGGVILDRKSRETTQFAVLA